MRAESIYAFDRAGECSAEAAVDARRPLLWALDFNVDPMSSVIAQVDGEAGDGD